MKFDVPSVVIDKLFNNGYEEQIVDFLMACEDKDGLEVSDIPISPTLMGDSGDKVVVRADGKDVTNSAIIGYTCYDAEDNKLDSCSSMEEGKEYKVRFNATYNGIKATNKQINIKPTC